jgi:hypothetical protein
VYSIAACPVHARAVVPPLGAQPSMQLSGLDFAWSIVSWGPVHHLPCLPVGICYGDGIHAAMYWGCSGNKSCIWTDLCHVLTGCQAVGLGQPPSVAAQAHLCGVLRLVSVLQPWPVGALCGHGRHVNRSSSSSAHVGVGRRRVAVGLAHSISWYHGPQGNKGAAV